MTPDERHDGRAVERLSADERRALVRCLASAALTQALRDEEPTPAKKGGGGGEGLAGVCQSAGRSRLRKLYPSAAPAEPYVRHLRHPESTPVGLQWLRWVRRGDRETDLLTQLGFDATGRRDAPALSVSLSGHLPFFGHTAWTPTLTASRRS